MNFLYQVIETQPQHAITISAVTPEKELPEVVEKTFDKLMKYIEQKDSLAIGPAFVAYRGMKDNNLEVEIGFPVGEQLEGEGDIKGTMIPGGKRTVGYYKGSYGFLPYFHEEMFKWILLNEMEPNGLIYEYYFNSPGKVPDEELLTKIEFLLKQ